MKAVDLDTAADQPLDARERAMARSEWTCRKAGCERSFKTEQGRGIHEGKAHASKRGAGYSGSAPKVAPTPPKGPAATVPAPQPERVDEAPAEGEGWRAEIDAMRGIAEALAGLGADERERVLRYMQARFGS